MQLLLDVDEVLNNHHLEGGFPSSRVRWTNIEDEVILSFQRHQAPIMNTSMKNGCAKMSLVMYILLWTLCKHFFRK
jgi:hypothetical protein